MLAPAPSISGLLTRAPGDEKEARLPAGRSTSRDAVTHRSISFSRRPFARSSRLKRPPKTPPDERLMEREPLCAAPVTSGLHLTAPSMRDPDRKWAFPFFPGLLSREACASIDGKRGKTLAVQRK